MLVWMVRQCAAIISPKLEISPNREIFHDNIESSSLFRVESAFNRALRPPRLALPNIPHSSSMHSYTRSASIAVTVFGALLNLALAVHVITASWTTKWEPESEWEASSDTWRVDIVMIIWVICCAHLTLAATVSFVGFIGILKVSALCPPPNQLANVIAEKFFPSSHIPRLLCRELLSLDICNHHCNLCRLPCTCTRSYLRGALTPFRVSSEPDGYGFESREL